MNPALIGFVITLLLISAAIRNKKNADDSLTVDGVTFKITLAVIFTVASLFFVMVTVVLAE